MTDKRKDIVSCKKCGCSDISNFNAKSKSLCIDCVKEQRREYRKNNIEKFRAYDRKRANQEHRVSQRKEVAERRKKDPELRKKSNDHKYKWKKDNSIKRKAHEITWSAIVSGKIIKKPCEVCGNMEAEAHHEDYLKPLEIMWLCKKHHVAHHRELNKTRRGLK